MAQNTTDIGPVIRAVKQANKNIELVQEAVYQTDENMQALLEGIENLTAAFHSFTASYALGKRQEAAIARLASITTRRGEKFKAQTHIRQTAITVHNLLHEGKTNEAKTLLSNLVEANEAPNYWLSACLAVVSAWLNNKPRVTKTALKQAIQLSAGNTSHVLMFFLLLCHNAGRQKAAMAWAQTLFTNAHIDAVTPTAEALLNAYRAGLFGTEEAALTLEMPSKTNWLAVFNEKRPTLPDDAYPLLQQHSPHWAALKNAVQTAQLHSCALTFLTEMLNGDDIPHDLLQLLENELTALIQSPDDEELPLLAQAQYEQRIIDCGGDEAQARGETQSIPHIPNPALTLILSRRQVRAAYAYIVQSASLPEEITLTTSDFSAPITAEASDASILEACRRFYDAKKQASLASISPTFVVFGIAFFLGGKHFIHAVQLEKYRQAMEANLDRERDENMQTLRDLLAELSHLRSEISNAQADYHAVMQLIDGLTLSPAAKPARKVKTLEPKYGQNFPPWDIKPL
ncbi:MAG: hypothetical protein FWC16_10770 [Defluviitaleaceae bacterium]|nr:hypothetical protein [Defluviitaleaceae bacterium]MCL2189768.1 hypothetical protein [Defluviitaleaceae bacterium]MCL2275400.1 hypothetical protein [Defluviitaleaceae bacterium]